MTSIITKAALAVALGALGAASQANAGGLDVDVYLGAPRHRPVIVEERPIIVRPAPRVIYQEPQVIYRPAPVVVVRPGRCNENLALQKAYDRGLNRVYIAKVNANKVVVKGRMRGMDAKMVFANVRGCPSM